MTWASAGRAWPPVALALLLGATLLQVRTAQVWHLDAPIFIALILVAAIGGWILGLLIERFISPHFESTRWASVALVRLPRGPRVPCAQSSSSPSRLCWLCQFGT